MPAVAAVVTEAQAVITEVVSTAAKARKATSTVIDLSLVTVAHITVQVVVAEVGLLQKSCVRGLIATSRHPRSTAVSTRNIRGATGALAVIQAEAGENIVGAHLGTGRAEQHPVSAVIAEAHLWTKRAEAHRGTRQAEAPPVKGVTAEAILGIRTDQLKGNVAGPSTNRAQHKGTAVAAPSLPPSHLLRKRAQRVAMRLHLLAQS